MAAKRRRRSDNRAGKIGISIILISFMVVMTAQIVRIYQKDQEYIEKQAELEEQLKQETDRQAELEEYEDYTKSQQYVEDTAKSKLGMAYDNEIVFKEESR